jgi:tetratricopeptide (TPR) repeat protein
MNADIVKKYERMTNCVCLNKCKKEVIGMKNVATCMVTRCVILALSILFAGCSQEQPKSGLETALEAVAKQQTSENYLNLSLKYYEAGQYEKCIEAAKDSLKLKPDYSLAYNNICAALNNLGRYDEGIKACQEALRLDPDFQLAKGNLNWALSAKQPKKNTQ